MDIIEIIRQDYARFPQEPTYSIYAENVYFQDPMTKFRGIKKYTQMINFMAKWFLDIKLELHHISRENNAIATTWTLNWTTPLPWKPRITITGRSELLLNSEQLIISHIDYWENSRLDVAKQHLFQLKR